MFLVNVASMTCSCRFLLYNIRRIHPFLTDKTALVLIQALMISCLDYYNSLLLQTSGAHPESCSLPESFHNFPSPFFTLSSCSAAPIQFKTLLLAYRELKVAAHSYHQALVKPNTPTTPLCCFEATSFLIAPRPLLPVDQIMALFCPGPTEVE